MPLPSTRNSSRASFCEILAQVRRETTTDLMRQLPFEILGELEEELFADDRTEDGIAQKLEALVRNQPVVGSRRVRQGFAQVGGIFERVIEHVLAMLELRCFISFRRIRHSRTNLARTSSCVSER